MSWYKRFAPIVGQNVCLNHVELEGGYAKFVISQSERYDIIVIDGRDRVSCMRNALAAIKESGVLVVDNTERDEYRPGLELLLQKGFRRIEFYGIGPINRYAWTTSLFYRDNNCLGI